MAKVYETITVVRKPRVDKLKPAPAVEERFDIPKCLVWPRASHEEGKGWVQIEGYGVFAPPGSDILADDQVICRGQIHSVDGKPGLYPRKGLLVTLERVGKS